MEQTPVREFGQHADCGGIWTGPYVGGDQTLIPGIEPRRFIRCDLCGKDQDYVEVLGYPIVSGVWFSASVLSGQPEAVVERNRERIEASITQGEAEVASGQLTTLDEALSGQPEVDR